MTQCCMCPVLTFRNGANKQVFLKKVYAGMPIGKLVEPEEAAYFTASLIDGVGTGQTGQFFCIDNGWAFV